jgi:hypothetical protein
VVGIPPREGGALGIGGSCPGRRRICMFSLTLLVEG